jgi:hypothetical protein
METILNSVFRAEDNLYPLKLAALYCDRITIPRDYYVQVDTDDATKKSMPKPGDKIRVKIVGKFRTVTDAIEDSVKPLVDDGLLSFTDPDEDEEAKGEELLEAFWQAFDDVLPTLLRGHRRNVTLSLNPTLADFSDTLKPDDLHLIMQTYFSFLAKGALAASLQSDKPILTDSAVVNELLLHLMDTQRLAKHMNVAESKVNFLTHQVLREVLPDIGEASIDDVLEMRYQFRNDLEPFRAAMGKMSIKIKTNSWNKDIKSDVDKIIQTDVKPKLSELKSSLSRSNSQFVKRLFRNLKNVRTYLPFIGTVMLHVEPSIAALAGAGLAGFEALYDTYLEKRKIRDTSGLVFLLKARHSLSKRKLSI